ncbi:KilA-N domain-containing protein [Aggregatibacter actinomycetemcomitans]|uniref:KilA-N domain-containing protein n=1 Tax=Aggregatibacter actinomycetemcomitans TaxID=714 RepID=UPI001E46876C|nr:KilA-N domain-containing protein [Aggregatibacter actinomycetemcomitans]
MNQLIVIDNTKIKQDSQGRYCLNDLHRASGGNPIHAPSQFLRLKGTKDFVSVLDIEGLSRVIGEAAAGIGRGVVAVGFPLA